MAPRLSTADITKQFVRLVVNCGDSRLADPAQEKLLVREWHEALRWYSAPDLHSAVSTWMRESKFFPSIAEILEVLRRDAPPSERHRPIDDEPHGPFCREGRTEAEEIAHRVAQVKRMKAQAGFGAYVLPEEEARAPAPASQDMACSEAVLNSCAGRRARKLPTCEYACQRRDCELRHR